MNPSKILESFKELVSWADDLELSHFGSTPYTESDLYVLFPIEWEQFDEFSRNLQSIKQMHNKEIGLIIDGDCPKYECDRINYQLGIQGVSVFWLEPKPRLFWSRWLLQISDGIDIIKEIQRAQ